MDSVAGVPILQFLSRLAEIFQELTVEELDLAGGTQGTDKPRDAIDEMAELALTFTYRFLRAFSLIDIRLQNAPTDNASFRIRTGRPWTWNHR